GNFCWVANVIMGKKLLRHHLSPLLQTTISFFLGFLAVSLILFTTKPTYLVYQQLTTNNLQPHMGVIYMALLSGALAYYLYRKAQKSIETSEADTFVYLQPLFGTPLAYFWLKEPITLPFIIGAIIIAIGVFLVERK
ncbi:MAG: DMT family transporter, partial [Patescibacteria group bacterium]